MMGKLLNYLAKKSEAKRDTSLIIAEAGGRTFGIAFEHPEVRVPMTDARVIYKGKDMGPTSEWVEGILHRISRATFCRIYEILEGGKKKEFQVEGVSLLGVGDNFCKETGRVRSLERALSNLSDLDKNLTWVEREKIWKAYHERPRPKTPKKETIH